MAQVGDGDGEIIPESGEHFDSATEEFGGHGGSDGSHDNGGDTVGGYGGHFGGVRRLLRHPSLHISGIPDRRRNRRNQNSNCLWQLERIDFADGGRHLLRNPGTTQHPAFVAKRTAVICCSRKIATRFSK